MSVKIDSLLDSYDYGLPEEQIAKFPHQKRDGGRLLCLGQYGREDRHVLDLPEVLNDGDLLVVNDTAVMHARLRARRKTGGKVEIFLLEQSQDKPVSALLKPSRKLKVGEELCLIDKKDQVLNGCTVRLLEKKERGEWLVQTIPSSTELMEIAGEIPIPPYFNRSATDEDHVRYQTVFAGEPGAVAAPTAGLHLSNELIERLKEKGVRLAKVTLHVGIGTFRNIDEDDLNRGELHPEYFRIEEEAVRLIKETKKIGGRIIAVGTTVTRCLESVAAEHGNICETSGHTRLFIRDNFPFCVIDGLLTNFHLPRSSLLMLVCAFGGHEPVLSAYRHAVRAGYRFYSYGDAMLLLDGPR